MRLTWQATKWLLLFGLGAIVLVACGSDEPDVERQEIEIEQVGFEVDFDEQDDFETGEFAGGGRLAIEDGRYIIETESQRSAGYLWGTSIWEGGSDDYPEVRDVAIEVDAETVSGEEDNWFGVMCRVEEDSGYAFLISADGFWAIARADTRAGNTRLSFLENWQSSDHINRGTESNHIAAYCVNDYLALYVNSEFIGDHRDDNFDRAGSVGLLAGGAQDNKVQVAFDNLVVRTSESDVTPVSDNEETEEAPTIEVPGLGDDGEEPTVEVPPLGGESDEAVPTIEVPGLGPTGDEEESDETSSNEIFGG